MTREKFYAILAEKMERKKIEIPSTCAPHKKVRIMCAQDHVDMAIIFIIGAWECTIK